MRRRTWGEFFDWFFRFPGKFMDYWAYSGMLFFTQAIIGILHNGVFVPVRGEGWLAIAYACIAGGVIVELFLRIRRFPPWLAFSTSAGAVLLVSVGMLPASLTQEILIIPGSILTLLLFSRGMEISRVKVKIR